MALIYITARKKGEVIVHRNPPTGESAFIVNVEVDLDGLEQIIVANDMEGYDLFASPSAAEVVTWASEHRTVEIKIAKLVD